MHGARRYIGVFLGAFDSLLRTLLFHPIEGFFRRIEIEPLFFSCGQRLRRFGNFFSRRSDVAGKNFCARRLANLISDSIDVAGKFRGALYSPFGYAVFGRNFFSGR